MAKNIVNSNGFSSGWRFFISLATLFIMVLSVIGGVFAYLDSKIENSIVPEKYVTKEYMVLMERRILDRLSDLDSMKDEIKTIRNDITSIKVDLARKVKISPREE